jgi:hypothetical protein
LDKNHIILASLPISTFWTTNFDSLLEDGLRKCGKRVDVKSQNSDFRNKLKDCNAVVYKMHGDINHPNETILLKSEFEDYSKNHAVFHSALMSDMMDKTFLFLGFSFTDPNLNYVLSRLRFNLDGNKVHYNITKRVSEKDFGNNDDYVYEQTKQEHFIKDLEKSYNIQTVLVDEWSDINHLLREIKKRNDRRTIYISGAATEYKPWDANACKSFVSELSSKLISSGYKLVTGYGLGVGSLIIAGALKEIYKDENAIVDDQIVMRPFPIGADKDNIDTDRYRRDMIRNTGITVFLFGNKEKNGEVTLSEGMDQELKWSSEQQNLLIPVGATGYKAEQYYNELLESYPSEEYRKYDSDFKIIGDTNKSPQEIIEAILRIVDNANK